MADTQPSVNIDNQIKAAMQVLEIIGQGDCAIGSYSLKHIAERWTRMFAGCPYISNDAVIIAAARLGFCMEESYVGPNCYIRVNAKRLEKIERATKPKVPPISRKAVLELRERCMNAERKTQSDKRRAVIS